MPSLPDWRAVLIAGSGPSQCKADLDVARGLVPVMTINETWRLAPWAEALYACDLSWWQARGPLVDEFPGLRISGQDAPGTICLPAEASDKMIWDGRRLGGGSHSGFQAINLAATCGARRIILTGYDCRGGHWHEPHRVNNPTPERQANWLVLFEMAAPDLVRRGVEVINCTRDTALECFPRMTLEQALEH